jgi:hypothetical protein
MLWSGVGTAAQVELVSNTLELDAVAQPAEFALLIRATELTDEQRTADTLALKVQELGFPSEPEVRVVGPARVLQAAEEDTRLWVVPLAVDKAAPARKHPRYLSVSLSGQEFTLPYDLTLAAVAKGTLSVEADAAFSVAPGEPVPITVRADGGAVHQLRVAHAGLIEKTTRRSIDPNGLVLCDSSQSRCAEDSAVWLDAGQARRLWLWAPQEVGRYEGKITLAASGGQAAGPTPLVVGVSTGWHQLAGALAIALGILASWFFFHVVKERNDQVQWRLQAAQLRERAERTAARICASGHGSLGHLLRAIEQTVQAFNDDALRAAGLPSIDYSSGVLPGSATAGNLKDYLEKHAQLVEIAEVGAGWLERTVSVALQRADDAGKERWRHALGQWDQIFAGVTPSLDAVSQGMVKAQSQAADAGFNQESGIEALSPAPPRSAASLRAEVSWLGVGAWAFAALLTTLSGVYLLVLGDENSGFGVGMDYLKCFLWGVGVPSAAQLFNFDRASVSPWLAKPPK